MLQRTLSWKGTFGGVGSCRFLSPPRTLYVMARRLSHFQSSHICSFFSMIQLANPASGTRRGASGFRLNNEMISDFNGISDGLEPIRNLQLRF